MIPEPWHIKINSTMTLISHGKIQLEIIVTRESV